MCVFDRGEEGGRERILLVKIDLLETDDHLHKVNNKRLYQTNILAVFIAGGFMNTEEVTGYERFHRQTPDVGNLHSHVVRIRPNNTVVCRRQ